VVGKVVLEQYDVTGARPGPQQGDRLFARGALEDLRRACTGSSPVQRRGVGAADDDEGRDATGRDVVGELGVALGLHPAALAAEAERRIGELRAVLADIRSDQKLCAL